MARLKKEIALLQLLKVVDPEAYEQMKAMIMKRCADCQEWVCDGCKHKEERISVEEDDEID